MKPTAPCMLPCRCFKRAACRCTPARGQRHILQPATAAPAASHLAARSPIGMCDRCKQKHRARSTANSPTRLTAKAHALNCAPCNCRSCRNHKHSTLGPDYLPPSTSPPPYRRVLCKVPIGRRWRHCPAPQLHEPHQQTASAAAAAAPAMAAPLAPVTPSCILFHSRLLPGAAPRCCRQATRCRLLQPPIKVI